jgi:hypothetical protein
MVKRLKLANGCGLIGSSKKENLSPKVTKLLGVIKLPEDFDYKKELGKALVKNQYFTSPSSSSKKDNHHSPS